MFDFERAAASEQLARRSVTFKKNHGFVFPKTLQDRYTMQLAGFDKCHGSEEWHDKLVDSERFKKHFDEHTLIDHDDIAPEGTPAPSPLMERAWASFTA
jgi:hypothetical protein